MKENFAWEIIGNAWSLSNSYISESAIVAMPVKIISRFCFVSHSESVFDTC